MHLLACFGSPNEGGFILITEIKADLPVRKAKNVTLQNSKTISKPEYIKACEPPYIYDPINCS